MEKSLEAKTRRRFFVIVIDTEEEIELSQQGYNDLIDAFKKNEVPQQFVLADKDGKQYLEQKHNIRMRETKEIIY